MSVCDKFQSRKLKSKLSITGNANNNTQTISSLARKNPLRWQRNSTELIELDENGWLENERMIPIGRMDGSLFILNGIEAYYLLFEDNKPLCLLFGFRLVFHFCIKAIYCFYYLMLLLCTNFESWFLFTVSIIMRRNVIYFNVSSCLR